MGKIYGVSIPVAGFAYVEVEADNEEEAGSKALGEVDMSKIEEWDVYRILVEGNVLYAPLNRMDVEHVDDTED